MSLISQTTRPLSTPDTVVPDVPCDSSVTIGDWVRINSSGIAVKAQADSLQNSDVFGLVEAKSTNTVCIIRVSGVSTLTFSGLLPESPYFLSTSISGQMNTTLPTGSGEIVLNLGRPLNSTRFLVRVQMRLQRA